MHIWWLFAKHCCIPTTSKVSRLWIRKSKFLILMKCYLKVLNWTTQNLDNILYGGDMRICLPRTPVAGQMPIYERIASWAAGCQLRIGESRISDTYSPFTDVSSVPTTRPWPVRPKRIGINCMVWHAGHNSESVLERKILHWAAYLWYWRIDIIFVWSIETWK